MADQNEYDQKGATTTPAGPRDRRAEGAYGASASKPIGSWLVDQVQRGLTVFGGGRAQTTPPRGAVGSEPAPAVAAQPGPALGMQPAAMVPPPPPVGPPPPAGQGTYFDPGVPMIPMAPRREVAGREFDYPAAYNVTNTPRAYEQWSFSTLRALAENYDLLRLLIETRKDQMETLTGAFLPKQADGQSTRPPADDRCRQINDFFESPDGRLPYNTWKRKLLDDLFVIDAPTLYIRRDLSNQVCRLEVVDGATIVPRIDVTGRPAEPPNVAYTQYLKGAPAANYRSDELIYWPRNLRPGRLYGCSPVQQIVATVTLGLKREAAKLAYYTTGNIPEALVNVPPTWAAADIQAFQANFDARMADPRRRFGKLTFVPAGAGGAVFTRSEAGLFGEFDEWVARIMCYSFSLPELPFVKAQNRATAQTADEAALSQGLAPLMVWWKSLKDHVAQKVFGFADIEYVYNDKEDIDPADLIETHLPGVEAGLFSIDELRGQMGDPPIGLRHYVKGVGPLGFMFVDDMVKASAAGLTIQAAAPPAPPMLGPDGQPMPGAPAAPMPLGAGAPGSGPPGEAPAPGPPGVRAPMLEDQMAGIPPELMAAVGLGPQGQRGRSVNVTQDDEFRADPMHGAVAHPQVLATLRAAERGRPPPGKGKVGALRGKVGKKPQGKEDGSGARV